MFLQSFGALALVDSGIEAFIQTENKESRLMSLQEGTTRKDLHIFYSLSYQQFNQLSKCHLRPS